MRFTLKPYQRDAVEQVLDNLDRAKVAFHRDDQNSSFSLTATTGAGKTVMAAAAIEALFYGSTEFDVEADPGAVVIWFSDDPNLNLQTRDRLMEASESFVSSDLVVIEPPFSKSTLDPGKVYFLSTGKLGKNSLLTRGQATDGEDPQIFDLQPTPDMQGWTIWETVSNTIADDDLTVYLILDEAHRGFKPAKVADKPTLVRRLINGHAGYRPIPVVWGISATIERFDEAMKAADASKNRRAFDLVHVSPSVVQQSGLVKDTIALSIPDEAGTFDITFVRLAAERLKQSADRWAKYAADQGDTEVVQPLLILQAPNTPDPDELGLALDAIVEVIPEIQDRNVRHVLGEHKPLAFGTWEVDWIEPQRVEDETKVRVLVAKEAISTGWDCPRAEVMVSFRRPSKENTTYVTQLLGRMVRSPLARRVPGDERLNAVDCILPFFDSTTAGNVVKYLTGEIEELPGSNQRKVLLDGRELTPNPAIPQAVWDLWEQLPTQTMPQRHARPVTRLVALAQALSADGIRPGALQAVTDDLIPLLDDFSTTYVGALETAIQEIWHVHVKEILGRVGGTSLGYQDFVIRADDRAIRTGFRFAKQAFGAELALAYVDHLAPDDEDDDFLREAFVKTSALAAIKELREQIDQAANKIATRWFEEFHGSIHSLTDERQQEYETIRGLAVDPQTGWLAKPRTRMEDYAVVDLVTDEISSAPLRKLHLMADGNGDFPVAGLNPWEIAVVDAEMSQPGALGWYRNPSRPAIDSLTIAYRDRQGNWHSMHPDFIFFHQRGGDVVASIVDPHGHHLPDALDKVRALATYADHFGQHFHRIEQVSVFGSTKRTIPVDRKAARDGLTQTGRSVIEFYHSDFALVYDPRREQ